MRVRVWWYVFLVSVRVWCIYSRGVVCIGVRLCAYVCIIVCMLGVCVREVTITPTSTHFELDDG